MIGFSATTGNVTEGQRLLSWEFSSGFVFLISSRTCICQNRLVSCIKFNFS
ncbi:BnaCnng49090D [Brassica napus]|uniref:BnaCnng49090D protein n=1 Tax=Brassica napus TaxID=3708 RepID=A0A078JJC8_BRANA|nr:BnaCnng49090D [Brassica napus]